MAEHTEKQKVCPHCGAALPEEAVKGVRRTGTGDEALVLRDYCPAAEPADLEELMVFMLRYAKGENAR